MDKDMLPSDGNMLMSMVNMWLRDRYDGSLDALCEDLHISRADLEKRLRDAGFEYSEQHKRFW